MVGKSRGRENMKKLYTQWIDDLGGCQMFLTGNYTTHRYQVRIRSPYRNVAIIAVAIILLSCLKVCSMSE
jgi:hypothetical protein